MAQSHFSLMWESYKSNICTGFSSLQHNGEFVDMTLAADGHVVKVHQVLMALSSPYLKELISSVPCQHPVIFLNNISQATLCLILEYMYTGEVIVPSKNLTSFIEAAKALHIKGLEHVVSDAVEENMSVELSDVNTGVVKRKSSTSGQISVPRAAKRIFLNREPDPLSSKEAPWISINNDERNLEDGDADIHDVVNDIQADCDRIRSSNIKSKLQFTLSIRGSLQVILNRYMYNLHCTKASGERRWRCLDYRNKVCNKRCRAFIVTHNNVVKTRGNLHNHPFHDGKILTKLKRKSVFSAIEQVKQHQQRELKVDTETPSKADKHDMTEDLNGVQKK